MTMENRIARFMRNSGPARVLVPIGLALLVFGIIMLGFNSENFLETTGRITSVVEGVDADNNRVYDVDIAYTVDGTEYTGQFSNISGDYAEGGDIAVFYNPDSPQQITNAKTSRFFAPIMIAVGALAMALGVVQSAKAFKKSKALDRGVAGGRKPSGAKRASGKPSGGAQAASGFEGFKNAPGVTEYYFRPDGNKLKPGYLIEDAGRNVLFEGRMLKNALAGARTFEFRDHTTGSAAEHQVGHTTTTTWNDEFFSVSSWFKFDGENVWDVLHGRGLRMTTNLHSKFPHVIYEVTCEGAPFARIETASMYVHEEDEAKHRLAVPTGSMYYRFWTASDDFDTLFLTIFAISESEQAVVE